MARKQGYHRTSGIDVQSACRSGHIEQGEVDLGAQPRCADLAGDAPVALKYHLAFFDSGAAHPLSCAIKVQTKVRVACARCLEPVEIPIDTTSQVAFVFSENQAEHVDPSFEPVLVDESGCIDP
ncbi:MAG TPA: hypothetical protein ENM98_00980, partial [Halothiobacillaceae bacterium]|nr:hypothetical protein [Halothiobacillaceae bacterium]